MTPGISTSKVARNPVIARPVYRISSVLVHKRNVAVVHHVRSGIR